MIRKMMTVLIAAGIAMLASAQDDTLPEFAAIDENEDGKIDVAEAEALAETLEETELEFDFKVADANEDGVVDSAEYAEYLEEMDS